MTHSIFPTGEGNGLRTRLLNWLRRFHWPSVVSGAAIGFAALHIQTTTPLLTQIKQLEHRVATVDSRMYQLVGNTRDAEHASDLLGVLITQGERVAAAREALESMDDLQQTLTVYAQQAEEAQAVAGRWHELAGNLIAAQNDQARITQAIEQIDALQQDVIALGTTAADGQSDIAASRTVLTEVTNLQQQIAAAAESNASARNALENIDALQNRLVAGTEKLGEAQQSADHLIALQTSLSSLPSLDAARGNAEQLIALQQTLGTDARLNLASATQNAATLLALQESLAGQSEEIVAGVENLELLSEFQAELAVQLSQVEGLRRQLNELSSLETSLSRTVAALEPITKLGDIRYMDDAEVRQIARTLLDRRRERIASAESKYDGAVEPMAEAAATEVRVPEPSAE
ncbi:MAG: hypothetical protein JNG89_13970 [Planctomycetaceae bacterium]|nr:hypothetical protein [Planctomycetaceae bacterium]